MNDLQKVGMSKEGYGIYRKPNGVGGYRYYTDELGALIWDTAYASPDTIRQILEIDAKLYTEETMAIQARLSDIQRLLNRFEEEAKEDLPLYMINRDNGEIYPIPRNQLEAFISFVGPVKDLKMPRHIALICPQEGTHEPVAKPMSDYTANYLFGPDNNDY